MPSQREQYGGTVLLFIGMGHNPYKITYMPFTFGDNSIALYRGLNGLFIFKSVPLFCCHAEAFLHIASWSFSSFVTIVFYFSQASSWPCFCISATWFRRYLLTYLENIVKLCFWGPSEAEGPQQMVWGSWIGPFNASSTYLASLIIARLQTSQVFPRASSWCT